MEQPISQLLLQSNIGRQFLSKTSFMVAQYYRIVVAILIIALLLVELQRNSAHAFGVAIALAGYGIYLLIRYIWIRRTENTFYTVRVQFFRSQASLLGITLLMWWLGQTATIDILWVLYLPALMMVSRYMPRQIWYVLVTFEACLFLIAVVVFSSPLPRDYAAALWLSAPPLIGLVLASFLTNYMTRVYVVSQNGAHEREQLVTALLSQVLVEKNGLQLWWMLQETCRQIISASAAALHVFDEASCTVRQLYKSNDFLFLGMVRELDAVQPIKDVILNHTPVSLIEPRSTRLYIPVLSYVEEKSAVLAVLELQYAPYSAAERAVTTQFLTTLLQQIWPLCTYASFRHEIPAITTIVDGSIHRLQLREVLDVVLEQLCTRLGFTFATISLVDHDQQEIRMVHGRGRNMPPGWVQDSHHPLDSHDIQADVLRTGKTEVIDEWDPRFDKAIWTKYNHELLIRAWVPLGQIGTIEAGFYKNERRTIAKLLLEVLERYAQDVTTAIENALLYEREQRLANVLTSLQQLSADLQLTPHNGNDRALLHKIASAARELLGADLILLYPLSRSEAIFDQPAVVGDLLDDTLHLRLPHETENIIRQIGEKREPYYQSDALEDSQLNLLSERTTTVQSGSERTFTARQQIRSFAGVPLLAQGRLLGVLAVNYRMRHQFLDSDRQILALFGQMAAGVIAGSQLQIQQERRRIELDLHDGVKSSLRGLISLSRGASTMLTTDTEKAADYLHEIRRAAWGILSDINMVIHNLTPGGSPPESLREYINRDIQQLMSDPSVKIDVQIDPTLSPLPHHLTRVLLFIFREAIANVYEHSKAKTARVQIRTGAGGVIMEIYNDGEPFHPDRIDRSKHQGLMSMEQRAQQVGGSFAIRSAADGTHITVYLPREEERDGWTGR